uniref:Uncharacterized protein n=1 Tax=Oryza sativa subsp. japonica TaxID=39947 RepID=Q6EQX6_ORYSJ|nr:hypothetical protein [Oryza sativa Japonica Group]
MELYPMVEKPVELLGAQLFHRCISMMSRTDVDFQRLRQRLDRMQVIMASSAGSSFTKQAFRRAGGGRRALHARNEGSAPVRAHQDPTLIAL